MTNKTMAWRLDTHDWAFPWAARKQLTVPSKSASS